jgi:predicted transposase/invertase (TIGR01784 family)
MTAAQQLRQEAMQEGIFQVAKSMLQDKEPIDKVAKWTGLSEKELERLKK